MISICKQFKIDAAHSLPNYPGKCAKLHGHTWTLEVSVLGKGEELPKFYKDGSVPVEYDGILVDFHDMKKIIETRVVSIMDHAYLNEVFSITPTAENMVKAIAEILKGYFEINFIRLWESPDAYAEWRPGWYGKGVT